MMRCCSMLFLGGYKCNSPLHSSHFPFSHLTFPYCPSIRIEASMAAKTGFWVDHSQNPVLGARLTLTVEHGEYLISGLTQLVTLAGGAAWVIAAFALHQYRSRPGSKDGLFLQEQVVLRNSTSAPGDIWQLLTMGLAWRRHMPKARRRACLILLVPLFIWCGFIAAGLFVARLTTPGYKVNNVLLKPGAALSTSTYLPRMEFSPVSTKLQTTPVKHEPMLRSVTV